MFYALKTLVQTGCIDMGMKRGDKHGVQTWGTNMGTKMGRNMSMNRGTDRGTNIRLHCPKFFISIHQSILLTNRPTDRQTDMSNF